MFASQAQAQAQAQAQPGGRRLNPTMFAVMQKLQCLHHRKHVGANVDQTFNCTITKLCSSFTCQA